jgi:hypothetical protein
MNGEKDNGHSYNTASRDLVHACAWNVRLRQVLTPHAGPLLIEGRGRIVGHLVGNRALFDSSVRSPPKPRRTVRRDEDLNFQVLAARAHRRETACQTAANALIHGCGQ